MKKAKITLYNITAQNPIILKDGQPCPISECKINSISQGEIEFEVEHFTTYSIGDADNFTCLEGEIKNSCVCGEEIFSTGFCCNSSAQNYDCEDYPPIEPIMVVEMCYDDIEGECVTIGDVTGTCIDGNFEEGCKRKKTDPLTGINKFLEENQMIIFGLGGLLVLMIIVLIANTIISKKSKNKKTKRNEPKKNISNQEFYTSQKQKNILAQKPPIKSDKGKSVNQNNFNEIVIKEIKKQKTKEEILKELRNELK